MTHEPRLWDLLTGEGRTLVPVHYQLFERRPPGSSLPQRLASSDWYQAPLFACFDFAKPISRCRDEEPPRPMPNALPTQETPQDGRPDRAAHRPFVLFACCIPVRGARRSVLCDLQRRTYRLIPNGLYDILTEQSGQTIAAIKAAYGHEFDREIDGYFEFLLEHELGFFTDEPERFPPLDPTYETPSRVTNAIIDVDAASRHDYAAIFSQLDDLGCQAVELRCFVPLSLSALREALAPTRRGRLRAINLLVAHTPEIASEAFAPFIEAERRLSSILVHSAPAPRQETLGRAVPVTFVRQAIDSSACCGVVQPRHFAINIETWSEARTANSCLNRKIAIDAGGEIRNCPSLPQSYGNASDTSLHSALARRDFKRLWDINKDQIEVCKDCEFRTICIDCRAYLTDPNNPYSKPAKCTYDPYTAQWGPAAPPGPGNTLEHQPIGWLHQERRNT
jgi:SPASM domain peptide maturase of grasp-with-spasm system